MTEAEMLSLLRNKYTKPRAGFQVDRYVRAAHVRYPVMPVGYGLACAIADYLVVDTYGSGELLGFEVKVSRSDYLRELAQPEKAEHWRQHCHRWFLVASDKTIVRDDLPEGWGLIVPSKSGTLRVSKSSAFNPAPEPLPMLVMAQLSRSIAQTATLEGQD